MVRVTRPGGVVACLDASVPESTVIQPFYQFYYKNVMTLFGGGISHRKEYDWLYESTQEFLAQRRARAPLRGLRSHLGVCAPVHVWCRCLAYGVSGCSAYRWTSAVADAVKKAACSKDDAPDA